MHCPVVLGADSTSILEVGVVTLAQVNDVGQAIIVVRLWAHERRVAKFHGVNWTDRVEDQALEVVHSRVF